MRKMTSVFLIILVIAFTAFAMISCQDSDSTVNYSFYRSPYDELPVSFLSLYDDGTFSFAPNAYSNRTPTFLCGKYTIDGNNLVLSIEETRYTSIDVSGFSVSITVNDEDSFIFHIDESHLEGFEIPATGDIVLRKQDLSKLDLSALTQSH